MISFPVIELRQSTLEVVPHHQHVALLKEFDGAAALLAGRALIELRTFAVAAENLHHAVGTLKRKHQWFQEGSKRGLYRLSDKGRQLIRPLSD